MSKTIENIIINLPHLNYFQQLTSKEKIEYFLDLYDTAEKSKDYSLDDLA